MSQRGEVKMINAAIEMSELERPYEVGREYFEKIVSFLDSKEGNLMDLSELERELLKKAQEQMRLLMQEHVERRGPGRCLEPVRGADGIDRPQERSHDRKIETIFGTIQENRIGYGMDEVQSLHPLDAELNVPPERYSLEIRRRVAEEAAKNSFDETVETIAKTTGAHVPKRQAEELAQRAAQDFDTFYESRQFNPSASKEKTGPILVITVDGKGVVMHEQDLRELTRKAAKKRKQKMKTRLSQGEKSNKKRMGTVAAVYTIDTFERSPEDLISSSSTSRNERRPHPEQKRVWASIVKEPEEVIEDAFNEASSRDPNQEKHWVVLVDGSNTQIGIIKRKAKEKGVKITIIVDIIHVTEYLWKAGRVFHPKSGLELETWVQHRLLNVLNGKASLMAGGMRRSATRKKLSTEERKPVDSCATYLINKSPYLLYGLYLSKGFPIATGVIEGACRYLVKDRMEITGAKWRLKSAEAVLCLRALRTCNDFEEYWNFHEACEYKRNHQNFYADNVVPPTISTISNTERKGLRIIK